MRNPDIKSKKVEMSTEEFLIRFEKDLRTQVKDIEVQFYQNDDGSESEIPLDMSYFEAYIKLKNIDLLTKIETRLATAEKDRNDNRSEINSVLATLQNLVGSKEESLPKEGDNFKEA